MEKNKLHFETLQLHVGQETLDPAPTHATCSFIRP